MNLTYKIKLKKKENNIITFFKKKRLIKLRNFT